MLTEMDIFLIGLLGGGLSGIALFSVMYWHFHTVFKDYFYNKDIFLLAINVKKLKAEILIIQNQVKNMNLDTYQEIVEEEYK